MTRRTSAQAFSDAASAMIRHDEVGDILSRLVADCVDVLGAEAAAILVVDSNDQLSLVSSSSSTATQIEMLQAQDKQGPCVDVIAAGAALSAHGGDELVRRWGAAGSAMLEAGFAAVDAYPLIWHRRVLGGLNVFRAAAVEHRADLDARSQAFADVATIVLIHSAEISAEQMAARVHEAITSRTLVEQAKGVLSELEGLDMEAAAHRLREVADAMGTSLSGAALDVIERVHRPPPG